jgi:hypothetical protein
MFPRAGAVLLARAEALALNDDSGSPAIEVAAVFFAFARDERRLGPDAARTLPIAICIHLLFDNHATLEPVPKLGELTDLHDRVAEGSADWPSVRAWFIKRVAPLKSRKRRR